MVRPLPLNRLLLLLPLTVDLVILRAASILSGFYLKADFFPLGPGPAPDLLLLGPFNGRPACQQIQTKAGKGVCADSFATQSTLIVPDVDAYPGHIGASGPFAVAQPGRLDRDAWLTSLALMCAM